MMRSLRPMRAKFPQRHVLEIFRVSGPQANIRVPSQAVDFPGLRQALSCRGHLSLLRSSKALIISAEHTSAVSALVGENGAGKRHSKIAVRFMIQMRGAFCSIRRIYASSP